MEPPVSVPRAPQQNPAATAAADPPLEPPGIYAWFQGFRVILYEEFSVEDPMANSSRLVLPMITAPLSFNFETTVPSY